MPCSALAASLIPLLLAPFSLGTSLISRRAQPRAIPRRPLNHSYDVCVFAHGASGSGKTFTMVGPPRMRGIAYRALQELMELAVTSAAELDVTVDASMVEIYNGAVRDLAADREGEASVVGSGQQPLSVSAAPTLCRPLLRSLAAALLELEAAVLYNPRLEICSAPEMYAALSFISLPPCCFALHGRRCECATWTTSST